MQIYVPQADRVGAVVAVGAEATISITWHCKTQVASTYMKVKDIYIVTYGNYRVPRYISFRGKEGAF